MKTTTAEREEATAGERTQAAGFDNQKRWGNSAIKGQGVNSPAMMEARSKEVSVESFNLPSGKLICGKFEDEAGARGFCKNCGGTHHQHRFARKFEHPPLTEAEKAHNAGAASMSSSYWPAPKTHETMVKHGVSETAAKLINANEESKNRTQYAKLWEERHDLLASMRWILERLERGGKAASSDAMQQARAAIASIDKITPKPTSEVEGKGKLPAFGIKRVVWGS